MMTKCQVKKVKFEGPSLFLKIWPEDVECGSFVSIIRKLKVSLLLEMDIFQNLSFFLLLLSIPYLPLFIF